MDAVVILQREKKTNYLSWIGSQYNFTKGVTHLLGG